jgi:AcrR family transcriptional regulator
VESTANRKPGRPRTKEPVRSTELLNTAARIFRDRGYAATSVQDIADAMGILKGSLYHYIESKEDLLWMIVESPLTDLVDGARRIAADSAGTAADRLVRMGEAHGSYFDLHHPHMFVITQESGSTLSPNRRRALQTMQREYTDLWESVLTEGVRRRELRKDLDVSLAAFGILGALNWMFRWFIPGGLRSGAEVGRTMVGDYVQGLNA